MRFEVYKRTRMAALPLRQAQLRGVKYEPRTRHHWRLVTADDVVVARGPEGFESDAAARSNIAAFRKSAKAVKFAKVVTLDAEA